jgi:hypothetical protein
MRTRTTRESGSQATFVVSVLIGARAGTPWPFGRLHIRDDSIAVRSMFSKRASPKSQIVEISLQRYGPSYQLLFKASSEMAGVMVGISMRFEGIVAELRRRGYPVVDRRSTLFPLTHDLPQDVPLGIVPWRDDDKPVS